MQLNITRRPLGFLEKSLTYHTRDALEEVVGEYDDMRDTQFSIRVVWNPATRKFYDVSTSSRTYYNPDSVRIMKDVLSQLMEQYFNVPRDDTAVRNALTRR